ncbi:monovalent cation/H+ antiporter complex subunit F [Ruania suaedae]|uniref:monovalent cation/H+ antiporter complex subunit F n=1 Tax=Ruania suaedae TaxID=2897774 RepID=UPI001E5AA3DD|nr:monovalent cation/H+ antiporter complex subunit F [Ruania suaedae]UFU02953.1 monovalent cation/H+ antiporter complex subunit F [Ruania suaedae]
MIGVDIAIAIIVLACLTTTYRMVKGPTDADRAIASDLLMFGIVGLVALFGVRTASAYTFDIVLVGALVGFLSALALGRALTRGKR